LKKLATMDTKNAATPNDESRVEAAEQAADERARAVDQVPYAPDDDSDEWMSRAGCRDADPELFSPVSGLSASVVVAVALCDGCPVRLWCRARRYDTGATGVWAGVYYAPGIRGKRRCALRGCAEPTQYSQSKYCGYEHEHAAKAGTKAGYELHARAGNDPCDACKDGRWRASLRTGSGGTGGARGRRVTHSGTRASA
jgi:WhiB family redox-sensing transcriptional regulator